MTERQCHELLETWTNGNRKDVMEAIGKLPVMKAVYLGVWLDRHLNDAESRQAFMKMIATRAT